MNLPDALLASARRRAQHEGRTVTSLVEQALRELLAQRPPGDLAPPLPTDGLPDGRFVIDIDDAEAVATVLDADGAR